MSLRRLTSLLSGKNDQANKTQQHLILRCPDCNASNGQIHDLFCTKERCPFCGGQLITCDCVGKVLPLSESEKQIWDQYEDDSVPPLSGLLGRWQEALNAKGRIPFLPIHDDLIYASYRRDMQAVQSFLNDGYSPNSPNEVGYTPMMGAVRGENVEALCLFLSQGGDAQTADHRGFTVLHWAVGQPPIDPIKQLACVQMLVKAGAKVNACDKSGCTSLMNAAWFGCTEVVCELLRHGADKTFRDTKGRSAGDLARERGHTYLAELLS